MRELRFFCGVGLNGLIDAELNGLRRAELVFEFARDESCFWVGVGWQRLNSSLKAVVAVLLRNLGCLIERLFVGGAIQLRNAAHPRNAGKRGLGGWLDKGLADWSRLGDRASVWMRGDGPLARLNVRNGLGTLCCGLSNTSLPLCFDLRILLSLCSGRLCFRFTCLVFGLAARHFLLSVVFGQHCLPDLLCGWVSR